MFYIILNLKLGDLLSNYDIFYYILTQCYNYITNEEATRNIITNGIGTPQDQFKN